MATTRRAYDVIILGGGPAGWAGAVRAWDLGRKVCLVERREGLGGAAVWGGAMGKHVMQEVCGDRGTAGLRKRLRRSCCARSVRAAHAQVSALARSPALVCGKFRVSAGLWVCRGALRSPVASRCCVPRIGRF